MWTKKSSDFSKRAENAVWAKALVVSSQGGFGAEGGVKAQVSLTLEVTPPGGRTYRTHTRWLVDATALAYIAQGQEISVRIDASDPRIIYPNASWAAYIPG
jgi:hypothetical protein